MSEKAQQYIPAGRTARFEASGREIQVQTEYAPRPTPRVTTTILSSGEVLRKVETQLENDITSQYELESVEKLILRQHSGLVKELKSQSESRSRSPLGDSKAIQLLTGKHRVNREKPAVREPAKRSHSRESLADVDGLSESRRVSIPSGDAQLSDSERVNVVKRTTLERLYSVDGVDKIFTTDWHGNFVNEKSRAQFKRAHGKLYKHLHELIEIFAELPNGRGRENGIYEATPRRLYMVSHCGFIYFLQMNRAPSGGSFEEVIRRALDS